MADFRKSNWGDPMVHVLASETATLVSKDSDALFYSGELNDSPCFIRYAFENGKLVSGSYMLDNADEIDVLDFFQLKDMLDEKYGLAEIVPEWRGLATNLNDMDDFAHSVASGDLRASVFYETTRSRLILQIADQDDAYNARVFLLYRDRAHAELEGAARREQTKEIL
jgi:hypothetical protein